MALQKSSSQRRKEWSPACRELFEARIYREDRKSRHAVRQIEANTQPFSHLHLQNLFVPKALMFTTLMVLELALGTGLAAPVVEDLHLLQRRAGKLSTELIAEVVPQGRVRGNARETPHHSEGF